MMGLYMINGVLAVLFLLFYIKDRRRLVNGMFFMLLLLISGMSLVMLTFETNNIILQYLVILLAMGFLMFLLFGIFIIIGISLLSARKLIKKEGKSLPNLLSLFLGVGLILWLFLNNVSITNELVQSVYHVFLKIINISVVFFIFMFSIFVISAFLYQLYRPIMKKDYIIVLGAGLLEGKRVTPLLAGRVDKAIYIYNKQKKKKAHTPYLVLSGGQGVDELVSEAEAMQQYAVEKGVPIESILLEDKSKNTYENMLFSKELIANHTTKKKVRILFTTTNYHVFRASIYAKKAGLQAQGIGARTKFYFWYNALLREFAAIVMMHRKAYTIMLIILCVLSFLIPYIISRVDFWEYIYRLLNQL